jgi:uncharacterized protein (DUF952 family)
MKWLTLSLCVFSLSVAATEAHPSSQYLYKILSLENWQATQSRDNVKLSNEDNEFIHFSTEKQLERIITKFWNGIHQFVVLKIDSSKLEGYLVLETNPGGTTQFYHLYNGRIPVDSVLESKIIARPIEEFIFSSN